MNKIIATWLLVCGIFSVPLFATAAEPVWAGDWVGVAKTARENTRLRLTITGSISDLKASMTLNDVGVSGWPIASITASANKLQLTLPSDFGMQKMDFVLRNGTLVGKWVEPNQTEAASVILKKAPGREPNTEKRILIDGPAGKIGASIILPNQKGPWPAIVFLHGSGPLPRDSNRFAAQRFAELGIASIIYDKRGTGESGGTLDGVSFDDLAADAIAVAEAMMAQVSVSKIGFSGHSQGGWVAGLAGSKWAKTGFIMTSAGPAVPPAREKHWTVVRAMRKNGASEAAIGQARTVLEHWHHGVRTGDWREFDQARKQAEKQTRFKGSELDAITEKPDQAYILSYKAFMDYDPIPAIKSLKVPYLAILSGEDESIDAMETREILEQLKKPNISIRWYAGYDHTLRKTGKKGEQLRFPGHPENYFEDQAKFIFKF